jgi:hypothetical protein
MASGESGTGGGSRRGDGLLAGLNTYEHRAVVRKSLAKTDDAAE